MEKVEGVMRGRSIGTCVLVGAIGLLVRPAVSSASIIEGPIVDPANGHSYYLLSQDTWTNSESAAESLGGHLATIRNDAENTWVYNEFSEGSRNLWIGFYDPNTSDSSGAQHAEDFVWVDGEPVTYTNWSTKQPDNGSGGTLGPQDYTAILGSAQTFPGAVPAAWDDDFDDPNTDPYPNGGVYGIVEVLPEPGGIALLASAALAAVAARRRINRP